MFGPPAYLTYDLKSETISLLHLKYAALRGVATARASILSVFISFCKLAHVYFSAMPESSCFFH